MLDMDQEITVLWEGDVVFQGEVIVPIRTSNQ